jgi:hypothetical protein
MLGFSVIWFIGGLKDSYSYLLGTVLGLAYALLLGNFVESIGEGAIQGGGGRGGALRFVPVLLMVLVYGKFKTTFSLLPELLGFFSYQAGSLLQAFNRDLYPEQQQQQKEENHT